MLCSFRVVTDTNTLNVNPENAKGPSLRSHLVLQSLRRLLRSCLAFSGLDRSEWLTVPKLFIKTMWFVLNTCFLSGSLVLRSCLQATLDTHRYCYWKNSAHLWALRHRTLGSLHRTLGSLRLVPSRLHHMCLAFAVFALYPFTVVNLGHEYHCVLSYANPSSESQILGGS